MKKLISIALALLMILALAACSAAKNDIKPTDAPKTTEAPEVTEEPATSEAPTEPTEAPAEQHEFKIGGADFCEKLVLGETYYYDLDGDGLCDSVYFNNDIEDEPYWGMPYLKITRGSFPDAPFIWRAPEDECTIWVVDSDPEDGMLEILETDDGPSADPESAILIPQYNSNGFIQGWGYGVIIDEDHPFSSDKGFSVVFWTDLMGTSILEGRCRIAWDEKENRWTTVRATELPYYYADYSSGNANGAFILKQDITAEVLEKDWSVKETITLPAGTAAAPYATDNESYLVLYLNDGRAVRVAVEEHDFSDIPDDVQGETGTYPWMIAGVWQDLLFDGIRYSG